MKVELRGHYGRNVATGEQVYLNQSRVFVDGCSVGFIGDHPGAKLLLSVGFGPIEREKIEAEVFKHRAGPVATSEAPDVPEELLQPPREEINFDDFDEG